MRRTSILWVIAIVAGCTATTSTTPNGGGSQDDGTTQIDQAQTFALIQGSVDTSVAADVSISVNHDARNVVIAPDHSFLVRDVPTGSVTFECATLDIRGTITIDDVQPGELIEVKIRRQNDGLIIEIVRRTKASEPPREVTTTNGEPLEIRASNVCFALKPGVLDRDVVVIGDNVSIVGAKGCGEGAHTALSGKLVIKGSGCSVFDVELRGKVVVTGSGARFQDSCNRCFGDDCCEGGVCHDGCDDSVTCHEGCGGHGSDAGSPSPDAGSMTDSAPPPVDSAPPPVDAGYDAPPPSDAGGYDAPSGD